jgi:integrase
MEREISAREIAAMTDGWWSFSRNLYLRVDGDRRRWICRITRDGRKRDFGCGSLATTSLALAKKRRDAILEQLREGLDPVAEKRERFAKAAAARKATHTFREAAMAVMENREGSWKKGSSSAASWTKYVLRDCKPLHRMPVEAISVDEVKGILLPFWDRGHHTAGRRVLSCIELTLEFAIAHGWRTSANVAEWKTFRHIAPTRPNGKRHHSALKWQEMPMLYAKLGESDGLSALALRMIILTGCRSGEIRGLRWSEVDFDARVITIPPERMKRETEHLVPITKAMADILKPLHATKGSEALVFPGPRPDKPLANQAAWTMIKRAADGRDITTHGCRSSLRSWMADHQVPFDVAEATLSHAPGSAVVNAYQRSSMLELRRPILEKWCRFVSGEGKLVTIGSRRKSR